MSRSERPNILCIHSQDTGRYVQPYGHDIPTRNIYRLAGRGVLFRQAFSGSSSSSASLACLLTGQCAHRSGMLGLAHRGFSLGDPGKHIVHTLREAGYVSVLCGVQHTASQAEDVGYDSVLGPVPEAEFRAAEFLDTAPDKPFFLSIGLREAHREFPEMGPEDDPKYILPPQGLPDTPLVRREMAQYRTSIRNADRRIGLVLEALDRNRLAGNTLVICTTDCGIAFPRMKCTLTDAGIGVMLIMAGPGRFAGGKVCDAMVSHLDLFPTICDLLGIEAPPWLEGNSMMPLMTGERNEIRDHVVAELNYHASYEPQRCVRTRRWKYIRRFDGACRPVLPNCDDGEVKSFWMDAGWPDYLHCAEGLYDLYVDPLEMNNLAGHGPAQPVLEDMRRRLTDWMEETDDPLLNGSVPVPAGAVGNDVDSVSPRGDLLPL